MFYLPLHCLYGSGMTQTITLLGGTGSIGDSTLDLMAQHPDKFELAAITAHENLEKLIKICRQFKPRFVAIGNADKIEALKDALADMEIDVAGGVEGIIAAAQYPADRCMAAIVGFAGLAPTIEAVKQGNIVMLANKECLVSAGTVFMSQAEVSGCTILPVDSEHNALYQIMQGHDFKAVDKFVLTASGGPFRGFTKDQLAQVTPEMAIKHPVWSMGDKISIDSATLMNKGLELIEAAHLFPVAREKFEAIIHPQSIVHGMVFMKDGSVMTQMGSPDMRVPISYCMGWPERLISGAEGLRFEDMNELIFEPANEDLFMCLKLAKQAMLGEGLLPTILNAANEVAVNAFRQKKIGFLDIGQHIEQALGAAESLICGGNADNLEDVLACDARTRQKLWKTL